MGLGIGSFAVTWVPIVGLVSFPLCGLGLIFGGWALIVALVRERAGLRSAIGGFTLCVTSAIVIVATNYFAVSQSTLTAQRGGAVLVVPSANRSNAPAVDAALIAQTILTMYPDSVLNQRRWPTFRGKTIELSDDPRRNVRLATELAQQGEPGPVTKRSLEQAAALMSEDAVTTFLAGLDEKSFRQLASPGGRIKVPRSAFDPWSREAGARDDDAKAKLFFRTIERNGDSVTIRYQPAYATMIDAAFFATIRACYSKAEQLRADERAKKIAAREANPSLTAPIFKVKDSLNEYVDKCLYFDNVWVHGDAERADDDGLPAKDLYRLPVTDERGEYHIARDEIMFVCSKDLADHWRDDTRADVRIRAKIFCQIGRREENRAFAEIYKIQTYNVAGVLRYEYTAEHGKQALTTPRNN